jgi:Collagen triple helix repeat (20 copies)
MMMFSRIRRRFTYANVAVTLALVFAMSGGAYAAGKYLITSTKQISPKVLTALKGKSGPAGKEGAPGKEGPGGKEGAPGKEGPAGKEGAPGNEGKAGAVGPQGPEGKEGKAGAAGQTGFTATLPSKATETGSWGFSTVGVSTPLTSISFPIPLRKELSRGHAIYVGLEELFEKTESNFTSEACPGKFSETNEEYIEAKAEPGYLCVYEGFMPDGNLETTGETATHNLRVRGNVETPGSRLFEGAGPTGAVLEFVAKEESKPSHGTGVWAVTAE